MPTLATDDCQHFAPLVNQWQHRHCANDLLKQLVWRDIED